MLVGGVLASLDGPGGFWTVMEALVDGFVAVEVVAAALLRVWLFAVFVVGMFGIAGARPCAVRPSCSSLCCLMPWPPLCPFWLRTVGAV